MPSKNLPLFINVKLHLELALAAQEMMDLGDDSNESREENEKDQNNEHHNDIQNAINYFIVLNGGKMPNECVSQESNIIKKRIFNYYQHGDMLFFKRFIVPKPRERKQIIEVMHAKLKHFNEQCTLIKICKRYYWHNCTQEVDKVVRTCHQCQLVKRTGSTMSDTKELKSIPIFMTYFIALFWTQLVHFLKPSLATSTYQFPSTIIQNGVKLRLSLIVQ